jgi:penicillin-insensitive murein endopeptidase
MSLCRPVFLRHSLPALFGALAMLVGLHTASAQETQSEEAVKRAAVLRALPDNAAKRIFGAARTPAPLEARSIGFYSRGCLAGAEALPLDGQTWQVMRTSRNRMWANPVLVEFLEKFAGEVPRQVGWPGILVGDMSQPRGGPMLTGHASHQVGLDADLWLTPMPERRLSQGARETMSAVNMVAPDWMRVDPKVWTVGQLKVIRLAAKDTRVERIFVNPAIKKALCEGAGRDREWLSKVRPMWGHNYHFHIRLRCPAGDATCTPQTPPQPGDGCGKEVDDWLALQHRAIFGPKHKPRKPKPPLTMADLPDACRAVAGAR